MPSMGEVSPAEAPCSCPAPVDRGCSGNRLQTKTNRAGNSITAGHTHVPILVKHGLRASHTPVAHYVRMYIRARLQEMSRMASTHVQAMHAE